MDLSATLYLMSCLIKDVSANPMIPGVALVPCDDVFPK